MSLYFPCLCLMWFVWACCPTNLCSVWILTLTNAISTPHCKELGWPATTIRLLADFPAVSNNGALIARALVQGAELLLMDEPTNHLDVYYQHQILHLVKQLNVTLIMTVHDLNLAAQYCQRLLLLDNGKLRADGTPDQVLQAELLSEVFRLPCVRDQDPQGNCPRVSFHLPGEASR